MANLKKKKKTTAKTIAKTHKNKTEHGCYLVAMIRNNSAVIL